MSVLPASTFEDIETRAADVEPRRVVLSAIAIPFFAIGWLVAHIIRLIVFVGAWAWFALLAGWQTARGEVS